MARPNRQFDAFATEARDAIAALNAKFDTLMARLGDATQPNPNSGAVVQGAVIADPSRPMPPGFQADPNGGPPRHVKTGQVYRGADADTRSYLERRLEADAAYAKEGVDYLADARAKAVAKGYPEGVHILEDGLPRNIRDGKLRPDLMTATYSPPPEIQPTPSMREAEALLRPAAPPAPLQPHEVLAAINAADLLALRAADKADLLQRQALLRRDQAASPPEAATQIDAVPDPIERRFDHV